MYCALYRKYRPIDFDSVVGQNAIVKTLKNSIINNTFSHAYMFFGPRGTGKTSVSKIFARNVNCLSPIDGNACGKCDACIEAFSKDSVDIIEIDAASNNGVNEIRELRNNVTLVPNKLKYKVYIIDEVHMLSDAAFNALLKTLEEPPEHIIFILATTDPQKVPETIISRCQCFSFKRISDDAILKRLQYVCEKEKIDIEEEVLNKISKLSDGGLRDALGLLDKMVSYTSEKITIKDFNEANGIASDEELFDLYNEIFKGNIVEVLNIIMKFNSEGKNLIQIIVQFIDYLRNVVVNYYISKSNVEYPINMIENLLNILNKDIIDIKKSDNPKIYIEVVFMKFISDNIASRSLVEKSDSVNLNLEEKNDLNNNDFTEKSTSKNEKDNEIKASVTESNEKETDKNISREIISTDIPKIINIDEVLKIRINNALATANKNLLKLEMDNFEKLRDYSFDQEIGYVVNELLDSTLRVCGNNNLIISFKSDAIVDENLVNLGKIDEVYNKVTNSNKTIAIISDDEWEKLKNEYITNLKNGYKYEFQEEPELLFEDLKENDIITNSAISLFGEDIVEIN